MEEVEAQEGERVVTPKSLTQHFLNTLYTIFLIVPYFFFQRYFHLSILQSDSILKGIGKKFGSQMFRGWWFLVVGSRCHHCWMPVAAFNCFSVHCFFVQTCLERQFCQNGEKEGLLFKVRKQLCFNFIIPR